MEFTAIVIAGGISSRMGTNKAELKFGGHSLMERTVHMLATITSHVLIVANNATPYQELGYRIISDEFPGKGPLAGIHAGLMASTTTWNLILACDMPFVLAPHIKTLITYTERVTDVSPIVEGRGYDAVFPVSAEGNELPLLAMYRRELSVDLAHRLAEDNLRVMNWTRGLYHAEIKVEDMVKGTEVSSDLLAFNMNYPEDYERAAAIYNKNEFA
ncbi:molybdopterin-guanine dinucleotide biosynthesis protein A [Paenibacillus shirakamiensis]|uniref:Probable molybdenum cofactor guanylyltransferase n=1 Tax=Paenibacillus shirakamiensis TaxID=1265935 RepID=A0ABS4JMM4_9BACL|nr:molybdenum cofactor guanylyltransferase [Paenibacillus shirakamiensis]MBP2001854.1 molybdopterin-guanine dinucleotide biosynthesis protein A [Paenibacillus shirakamiensis]